MHEKENIDFKWKINRKKNLLLPCFGYNFKAGKKWREEIWDFIFWSQTG